MRSIRVQSRGLERIVLLADRTRSGLEFDVEMRDIPPWYLAPALLGSGCQAKLCLIEPGVVPDDMPAVYLDLDTLVLGDLSRLPTVMEGPETVAILQSAVPPFGAFARWLYRATAAAALRAGNSSIVVFHPAQATFIATRFRALVERYGLGGFRPPIRRRQDGLVAVTFPGVKLKGEDLVALPEGAVITERKGRKLFWTDHALGGLLRKMIDIYSRAPESSAP